MCIVIRYENAPGEAQLLVSEFPPPPFYYKQASSLVPPPIPTDALERGTRRAAAAAAKARAESVRIRLGEDTPNSDAILGGSTPEDEEGDVVAVFGEIVEVSDLLYFLRVSGARHCLQSQGIC